MDEFYAILDLPLTATYNEIKAQYQQLVRIYCPDYFSRADDKSYTEEKLKQINLAFHFLGGSSPTVAERAAIPQPIVYPPKVDFGLLPPGRRRDLPLWIGNLGSAAAHIQVSCHNKDSAFQVAQGRRLYGDHPFPCQYTVTADTHCLTPNRIYKEWLEVTLDDVVTHVELCLQVAVPIAQAQGNRWLIRVPGRLAVVIFMLLITLLVTTAPSFERFVRLSGAAPVTSLSQLPVRLQPGDLLFAVQDQEGLVVQVAHDRDPRPIALGIRGHAAVGSIAGQRVAYVGPDDAVYIMDLRRGQTQPILSDGSAKRALSWSPDGKRLAYLVGEGKQSRIGLYHIATGVESLVPAVTLTTTEVSHYAWAPTGHSLLFDQWQAGERRLYRSQIDEAGLAPLTYFDSWDGAWSPDEQWLVVNTPQGLYRLDQIGGQRTKLTDVTSEQPSWSADGQWLAYRTRDPLNGIQTLWIMYVTTGQARVVSTEAVSHAWSPTGNRLGYVTGRNETATQTAAPLWYLWTVTPGKPPELLAEVNDPSFQWVR